MRSSIFVACLAVSLSGSCGAAAQPTKSPPARPQNDARTDQARELHVKGAALYEQGQYEKAEAAFLAAWALKKHHQLASNLGACEMKLGRYRDAAEHLAFFLREQPPAANPEDRKRTQALFDEARAKVAVVVLRVNVAGAVVSVDGREIGAAPFTADVYLEPGARTLVATHGSYKDAQQVIEAKAGGTQTVTLDLLSLDGRVAPAQKRSVVPGAVMGAIGGAAAIAGIGLLAGASSKASSASALHDAIAGAGRTCTTGAVGYDARCEDLASSSKSANTLRDAGAGILIGAGIVAAGAVTYFLWPQSSAPVATGWSLRAAPSVSASSGGVILLGTF